MGPWQQPPQGADLVVIAAQEALTKTQLTALLDSCRATERPHIHSTDLRPVDPHATGCHASIEHHPAAYRRECDALQVAQSWHVDAREFLASGSGLAGLGALPFVLAAATGLAAVAMVRRPSLEQLAAPPVRTDREAVGIDPFLVLVAPLGLIVDPAIQPVDGGDVK